MDETEQVAQEEFDEIYYNELGLCGCGLPEELNQFLINIVDLQLTSYRDDPYLIYETKLKELIISIDPYIIKSFIFYIFEKQGLMKHESNVGNSWLTDKGIRFIEILKSKQLEEIKEDESI